MKAGRGKSTDETSLFRVYFLSVNGHRNSQEIRAIGPRQAGSSWLVKNPGARVLKVKHINS